MDGPRSYILRFVLSLIFGWSGLLSYGQNLIPNYSFEDNPQCPYQLTLICWDFAPPWDCATAGTCDLYHECAGGGIGVPNNLLGQQEALTGRAYAGFLGTATAPNHREYFIVPLLDTLEAGTWYDLNFYLSLPEESCGIEHIGAHFARTYQYVDNFDPLPLVPQIETDYGFLDDMEEWMLISGCYQAEGGEVLMIIGNFRDDANTPLDPNCDSSFTYYYIEDVSLTVGEPPESYEIDLNGPVTECFSFEIEPEDPGLYYSWSDGSHEPTLVVTTTGEYTVTVTDGCDVGVGTIDVTILDSVPPIDLGSPDTAICNGEEFTIVFDPDVGEVEWSDGSVENEYTISTPGVYTVTVSNICSSSSDQITVDVVDPPTPIDLGEDVFLCEGDAIQLAFDPSLGEFEWNDHSTNPEYTITQGGTYALTVSNMCGQVTDEIIVTSLNLPEIDLGDDVADCTGEVIDIELNPELGDFIWQDGSMDSEYSITDAGIYSVTVTNSCGSVTDQIQVSFYDAPVFELGPDLILCPGDTIILDGDGIVGMYHWHDNSYGNTFEVTSGGTYSLSLTTGCGTAVDSVTITYETQVLPPDLGVDFTLCPGESHLLQAASPGAEIVWQDGTTADSFLVTSSGTYFVNVQNSCDSFSDTVNVVVNANPPQLNLPAAVLLCQGSTAVLEANVSGVSYVWNDASQNDSLLVSTPGSYSLTISNACGTDSDTVIVIDNGPSPAVFLGNDVALCPGDTIVIHPQSADVNSWLWQDGSTDSMYTVTTSAVVSVITANNCGTAYDTLVATLLPATPPLDLGNDTALCIGQSFTLTIATPDVNILWSNGSSNNQVIIDQPGELYATISNACGQTTDTIIVNQLPPVPSLHFGIDQSLCPGEIITLAPGIDSVNYVWHDGSSLSTFNATQAGSIYLTISNSCGSSTDTIIITESTEGPQVNLGTDIIGCEGDVVTIASDISGVDFVWQDGSTSSTITTSTSGIFILAVSNNCGSDADTVMVDIHGVAPQTNLGPDTLLCTGNSFILTSSADSETVVTWQDGSTQSSFLVNTTGTYYLLESNHCGTHTDTIHVDFKNAPDPFDLGRDTTLCPGESIILIAPPTTNEIIWQDGSTSTILIANNAQVYSLFISNECGTVSDQVNLAFDNRIPTLQLDPEINLCPGERIELDVTQLFPVQYQWNTGLTSPVIQISSPGNYAVTISSPCAESSGETEVIISDSCFSKNSFHIPNVFSPNGDNINDNFSISWNKEADILSVQTSIFDRWGNLVFHSNDIHAEWNGDFNGKQLNPGVYIYQIELQYYDNNTEQTVFLHGDVTLIR